MHVCVQFVFISSSDDLRCREFSARAKEGASRGLALRVREGTLQRERERERERERMGESERKHEGIGASKTRRPSGQGSLTPHTKQAKKREA